MNTGWCALSRTRGQALTQSKRVNCSSDFNKERRERISSTEAPDWSVGRVHHSPETIMLKWSSCLSQGLYICKQMCKLQGGDITLRSEPGMGSTFTFFIPVEACKESVEGASPADTPRRPLEALPAVEVTPSDGPLHVLLAEDNRVNQLLLQKQLVKAGCVVAVANDGLEALNYVLKVNSGANSRHPLDLILMGEMGEGL